MDIQCLINLPYRNFKWSNDLSLDKIQPGIYEVDISIPKELHNEFKDYPLCCRNKINIRK